MKVMAKAEKGGKVVAQSEISVKEDKLLKGVRKAFAQLRMEHPDLDLFDPDLRIKFDKIENKIE